MKALLKKIPGLHFLATSLLMAKDEDLNPNLRAWGVLMQYFAGIFPDLLLFNFLRVLALRLSGTHFTSMPGVVIRRYVFVEVPRNLTMGKNVQLNINTYIGSNEKVAIGDGTRVGMNVHILTTSHKGAMFEIDEYLPVTIEHHCHIGAGAIILPGAYLEANTLIAPGSVVSGRTKSGGIYVGNPARLMGMRQDL